MTRPTDDVLLAFLEGTLDGDRRESVLAALASDPELARQLRHAARGLEGVRELEGVRKPEAMGEPEAMPAAKAMTPRHTPRRVSPWWVVAAAAASVALAVPATISLTPRPLPTHPPVAGQPASPRPSFVLVLQGTWPDAAAVDQTETQRRADEYWTWTTSLSERDLLLAAGDLRWEPGTRLGDRATPVTAAVVEGPDFVVGMFAVRADSYDEAMAIARECPHLRYGGTVSVRRVGGGFVTGGGFGDWEG